MALSLGLDIGNSQTVGAWWDESAPNKLQLNGVFRFPTAEIDRLRSFLQEAPAPILRVIVCSVVPEANASVKALLNDTPQLWINREARRDFSIDLPHPERMGADRLANAAAATWLNSGPCLIVDAGTATKFCLIDHRPAHIGGAISPGLEISAHALFGRAAQLKKLELHRPPNAIGKTTEEQMLSGVIIAHEQMIEAMANRLLLEAGEDFKNASILLTGGCAEYLQLSKRFKRMPLLTLFGLARYGQLNV